MTRYLKPLTDSESAQPAFGFKLYTSHIGEAGNPYMRRWILTTPVGAIRLHHIIRADRDRYLHDHPFDFVSIILKGFYVEELPLNRSGANARPGGPRMSRVVRWVNRARAQEFHRISEVSEGGVWTLVFAQKSMKPWGFMTEDGWRFWRDVPGSA